jgi:hypothetical protein
MEEFNAYYFPWVRKGLGTYIDETDSLGENDGVVLCRPELTVKSKYTVQHERPEEGKKDNESEIILEKTVKFTGPGDILRLNTSAVMKVHPEAGSEGFPTQYLPYIEFWEPDFLWRYTPASENKGRLRPWMALLVCQKELVRIGTTSGDTSYFTFIGEDMDWEKVFPDVKLLHRSAHAQGNEPDKADFCRLLGMRNQELLEENTDYVALLVPAYETGRLRGLGLEEEHIREIPAQQPAWEATLADQKKKRQGLEFPIYYKWYFKAGTDDFDTIAARLEPVGEELKAGLVLDVTDMGEGFSYNTVAHGKSRTSIVMPAATLTPQYKSEVEFPAFGVAKYQTEEKLYKNLDTQLSENPVFAENRANIQGYDGVDKIGDDDPMVVPPVYGARHAMATKLDENSVPWLKELNMDVHHRAAAGLGRRVVQKHQEELMDRAWKQVEAVQALNMELYQRLMSINANKALQRKSLDLFVDDNDPSKFLGYFMRYLVTMKNAAGENAPSLDSIIKQAEIPASFATPSFQQNADKLAKVVADLDSTTLMESIVKNQLYKFTTQEPAGAVTYDSLVTSWNIVIEAITYAIYREYWSGLYGYSTKNAIYSDLRSVCRIGKFSPKTVRLVSGLPVSTGGTLQMPLEPYRLIERFVVSRCNSGEKAFDSIKEALYAFQPDDYNHYPRLYVLDDNDYKKLYKGNKRSVEEMVEKEDGLNLNINGTKKTVPFNSLILPNAQNDLFMKEGPYTQMGHSFTSYQKIHSVGTAGTQYRFMIPIPGGYRITDSSSENTEEMKTAHTEDSLRICQKEGVMADEIQGLTAVRQFLEQSLSQMNVDSFMDWFINRSRLIFQSKDFGGHIDSIFTLNGAFHTKVLKRVRSLSFSLSHRPNQYIPEYCQLFFENLIAEDFPDHKIQEALLLNIVSSFLYTLLDYPCLLHRFWKEAGGDNTILPALCYLETVGPWMTAILAHRLIGSKGGCSDLLHRLTRYLTQTPTLAIISKSSWEARTQLQPIEGGLRECIRKAIKQLYPDERDYIKKSQERIKTLINSFVIRKEKPVVPVDRKAVTELKESMENKEAIEQMRKVARTYYEHFYADTEEGKRLREKYIDELLMSKYPILAYPFFPEPTYYYLNMISDKFIVPGLDQIPMDHIAMFTSNPEFTEAFLCGMNTEMGSELQWREYPTDRRGSYFRKFWDSESSAEAIRDDKFFDVKPLHLWNGTRLGQNHLADKGNLLIFAIHSDLFKLYPNTHVFLNEAAQGKNASLVTFGKGRKDPVMETFIRENILLVGFNISLKEALGVPRTDNYGYLLAFEQDLDDLNFSAQAKGLDNCQTSAETANLLKDKVTIFGKHISRFMDAKQ